MRGRRSGKRRYRACALRRPLAAAAGPVGLLKAPRPGTDPAAGTGMEAAPATAAAPGWRCRPGGRLDMSHGFVRHIRRNQLARYRHRPGPPGTLIPGAPGPPHSLTPLSRR